MTKLWPLAGTYRASDVAECQVCGAVWPAGFYHDCLAGFWRRRRRQHISCQGLPGEHDSCYADSCYATENFGRGLAVLDLVVQQGEGETRYPICLACAATYLQRHGFLAPD